MAIHQLDSYREAKAAEKKKIEQRKLDAQASYTEMARCLKLLEMNSMPELRSLKAVMRNTMREMVQIGNDKKTN